MWKLMINDKQDYVKGNGLKFDLHEPTFASFQKVLSGNELSQEFL